MRKGCKEFKKLYNLEHIQCCPACHICRVEDMTQSLFLRPDPTRGEYDVCCEVADAFDKKMKNESEVFGKIE